MYLIKIITKKSSEAWIIRQADSTLVKYSDEEHDLNSLVEVGSLTKTITAKLVASLVKDSQIEVNDPVEKWLEYAPKKTGITVCHLLTHQSGLPQNPPGTLRFSRNPYAKFTEEKLQTIVKNLNAHVKSPPATKFIYSNLGYSILGKIIESSSGMSWIEAVDKILFQNRNIFRLAPESDDLSNDRLLHGRGTRWDMSGPIRSAGGLWSTVQSTFDYVESEMYSDQPWHASLGWRRSGELVWHNGGTRCSSIFAAYLRDKGISITFHSINQNSNQNDSKALDLLRKAINDRVEY